MKNIFKDKNMQNLFDRDGFVLLDNVIAEKDILDARNTLMKMNGEKAVKRTPSGDEFFCNLELEEIDLCREISRDLAIYFRNVLTPYLSVEYRHTTVVGIVKIPGEGGLLPWHNHLTNMILPSEYPQITLHIPLQNVSDSNGPIAYAKGCQKAWENKIILTEHLYLEDPYPHLIPLLERQSVRLYPKLGQGILFNSSLPHKGLPNLDENQIRMNIFADFIPKQSQYVTYEPTYDKDNEITSLHGYLFDPKDRGKIKKEVHKIDPYEHKNISIDDFYKFCGINQ